MEDTKGGSQYRNKELQVWYGGGGGGRGHYIIVVGYCRGVF